MANRFIDGTVNAREAEGDAFSRANLLSAGFKPIGGDFGPLAAAASANYNGGIAGKRIGRLEKGDLLFRFSDSAVTSLDRKCSGLWWFDLECLKTIRHVARASNVPFQRMARSLLGILFDWGDMGNLVGGKLTADFWCYKGLSNGYAGTSERTGQVQNMSAPERQDVIQLFIPGYLTRAHLTEVHDDVLTSGLV